MDIKTYKNLISKKAKYNNKKVICDGIKFDSIGESRRYYELKLLERAGEIWDLQLQVRIPCLINDIKVFTYVADFVYTDRLRGKVIEDFKGMLTDIFKLKQKILKAQGIEITIVKQ